MSDAKQTVKQLLAAGDVKINGKRPWDIQVHDERVYKRMLKEGELGAGEAYMQGWWSAEHLDQTVAKLFSANFRQKLPLTPSLVKAIALGYLANRQNLKRARKNAVAHYDIGNDLYEQMLDSSMVYTCGYWEHAKTLAEAQKAKLDRVCQKLQLKPGMTILDIGCGWGGFAEYAAKNYGAKVTGITLASEQLALAKQRTKDLDVKILLQDYRDASGKYDRVISIGMMEAVGPKNLKTFFKKCEELLKDDGIMLHHTIGNNRSVQAVSPWIDKYIFPGGVIPSLAQIAKATEKLLIIEDVENFGPYYDKTLMAWHHNFIKNYKKLDHNKYDQRFYRMWEFYLLSCAGSFRARHLQLFQIVFRKIRAAETYKAYR